MYITFIRIHFKIILGYLPLQGNFILKQQLNYRKLWNFGINSSLIEMDSILKSFFIPTAKANLQIF